MAQNGNKSPEQIEDDFVRYYRSWLDMQNVIWKEKIERLRIVRSGALHNSFENSLQHNAMTATLEMRFREYGLYQAAGSGRCYNKENGGDLEFLDPEYRKIHGLDKPRRVGPTWGGHMTSGNPRKRRDWFSKKLFRSQVIMREKLAAMGAEMAIAEIKANLDSGNNKEI